MEYLKPKRKALMSVFEKLLNEAEKNICYHEDTYRGGTIWTICRDCGRKWADDLGGFVPYVDPEYIVQARQIVQQWKGSK